MSTRARQREAHRAVLKQRCAQQREQLADSLQAVQAHLQPLERTLAALRSATRAPLLSGAAAALVVGSALLFSRRRRGFRVGSFSWLLPLAAPALRLLELWWRERRTAAPAQPLNATADRRHS